jgi:hypothetical protein
MIFLTDSEHPQTNIPSTVAIQGATWIRMYPAPEETGPKENVTKDIEGSKGGSRESEKDAVECMQTPVFRHWSAAQACEDPERESTA